ncbi:FtsX-like permease family protein [Streptomyces sp. NPDC097619]|uniref:ABC transporter permease n=1 Tax=Streptomyces sp. NPDC097619 TaxID=3157228 RepID=UPI00332999CA
MSRLAVWAQDLRMGARFALGGGREGWTRTLLTAVGVGLGVALLLVTTALPSALQARDVRYDARSTLTAPTVGKAGPGTLLVAESDTTFRGTDVYGRQLQPEGPQAPLPPGLKSFPGPGELAVSPALDRLLKSSGDSMLRERLNGPIVSVIGDAGLIGPNELAFYQGQDRLQADGQRIKRVTGFANDSVPEPLDPVLSLLLTMVFVALLMPVAVFIAAAVRFGGDRRDRRLAALRLVGADGRMTRRIAAGEAAAGSVLGLGFGAVFFLAVRHFAGEVTMMERSVFPADLNPTLWLAALVGLAVPAAAVAVTLFALRGVVIEPLGVVRTAKPAKRRIWWRLLMPVGGLALLAPMMGRGNEGGEFNQYQVIGGVVLLLVGITALLPWLVERTVARLGGGGVAWQLAVRRLQLSGSTAARLVNGIAVAVAGAIALQMLFAGVESDYTKSTGQDTRRAAVSVHIPAGTAPAGRAEETARELGGIQGVHKATALSMTDLALKPEDPDLSASLTVGDCAALSELARLPSCKDGDTFVLTGGEDYGSDPSALTVPGTRLFAAPRYSGDERARPAVRWTLPADARTAPSRKDPTGVLRSGVLATPSAAPKGLGDSLYTTVYVQTVPGDADALERVRTAVFLKDPMMTSFTAMSTQQSNRFAAIRTGLFIGATGVLVLIGASMLVSQLEQLRERRKLLSALVAFGTRRSTLSMSVLWQTAVPIGLGLLLATAVGLALGAVLLRMSNATVAVDWSSVLAMTGIGAGVVVLVTALSLPPLLRLMRPDGLRTE